MNAKHLAVAGVLSTSMLASSAFALAPDAIDPMAPGPNDVVIHYAGSTAQKVVVTTLASDYCDTTTEDTYNNTSTTQSAMVISCQMKAAAPVPTSLQGKNLYFSYFLAGGSIYGVTPVADHLTLTYMAVHPNQGGSCDTTTHLCDASITYDHAPDGGGSDVEPSLFHGSNIVGLAFGAPSAAGLANLKTAQAFNVIFGIGVSCSLLNRYDYPTCGTPAATYAEEQKTHPISSLSKASLSTLFLATAQGGKAFWDQIPEYNSVADRNGDGVLDVEQALTGAIPPTTINVCRRKPGSGTQASAQAYFLNQECGGPARSFVTNAQEGSRVVEEESSTKILTQCLDVTTDAVAISGTEKAPGATYGTNWAYVKIDGIEPTKANAATGKYTYMFENSMQYNKVFASADAQTFLDAMFALASDASALSGVPGALGIPDGVINHAGDPNDTNSNQVHVEYVEANPVSWTTRGGLACRRPVVVYP